MPVSSPLTPKSVLRHRPLDAARTTKEKPLVTCASRPPLKAKENVPPFVYSTQKILRKKGHVSINLTSLGVGMMVALIAVLLGQLLVSWFSTTWDDIHYGRPRTYQTDAFVGHESGQTPSHFIVLNLHGRIDILELPGGDPTRAKLYLGPQITGPGSDMVPVTVQFPDSQRTHHPDMLISFQGTQVLFHNVHGTFLPSKEGAGGTISLQ